MLCPVCLQPVELTNGGLTGEHDDTAGNICPMSGKPAFFWDEPSTREAVRNRSGGICEYCHQHRAQEKHHRKSLGVGGKWSPANILDLCTRCHRHFTAEMADGYALGVCVRRRDDPGETVVIDYNGTPLWLTDDVAPPLR